MKVTRRNLSRCKRELVTLACRIVHERDKCCQYCGRREGKLDAAHIVRRGRGWLYAADPENIVLLCRWHHDLLDHRRDGAERRLVLERFADLNMRMLLKHGTQQQPVTVRQVQAMADELERQWLEVS